MSVQSVAQFFYNWKVLWQCYTRLLLLWFGVVCLYFLPLPTSKSRELLSYLTMSLHWEKHMVEDENLIVYAIFAAKVWFSLPLYVELKVVLVFVIVVSSRFCPEGDFAY